MDPYIEAMQRWADFRQEFLVRCREQLNQRLPDNYAATLGERIAALEPRALAYEIESYDPPKQLHVHIIHLPDEQVITDIELLSPSNKHHGSRDRAAYLANRQNLGIHGVNIVELDLLVTGARIPMRATLPARDYYALITPAPAWNQTDVYAWSVRDSLPALPIPLKPEDGQALLDLASAFAATYEHGRYRRLLRYARPLRSGLSEADRAWAEERARSGAH
jgi:hypothetical protein